MNHQIFLGRFEVLFHDSINFVRVLSHQGKIISYR
jgi:hypothetical protein